MWWETDFSLLEWEIIDKQEKVTVIHVVMDQIGDINF